MIWLLFLAVFATAGASSIAAAVVGRVDWVRQMRAAVDAALPQLGPAARLLIVAHAAYESGWGSARAARYFNVFNLTAGSAWSGPSWVDVGGDSDGAGNRITQTWRMYSSLQECVADYWHFLGPTANHGRYVLARAALAAGDVPTFVLELSSAGYFALSPGQYLTGLSTVLEQVKGIV